ncbi:MAG: hypothetical protein AB1610_07095 [Nitrospirota bacterium]
MYRSVRDSTLDQEITSQGYCYQALIYFYLRKQDVRNDEIDIYINFLTEMAFYFFKEKKHELSSDDFTLFMKRYLEKYNLPIKQEILLKNLSQIISVDSFNNYSFRYLYIYYFFVAKYLAEHTSDSEIKNIIENTMQNLHVDENAYIVIFMTHHSKNIQILDEIELNALNFFDKYKPVTLTKDEVKFFDERANIIVKAVLPPANTTSEEERYRRLGNQDEIEQSRGDVERKDDINKEDSIEKELRKAIRTVEVMGCIIKNRAGSLEKTKLEEIFKEAMNVHLRILSSFFKVIEDKENQRDIVDFILERLEKIIEEKKGKLSREKLEEISRTIFWNLNFFVVYGVIYKIVCSLGSDKLIEVVNKVCNEINTPASFIIRHGILMWYNKNLQVNEIVEKIKEKDFSAIAERVVKLTIVNHCALHPISYKDRQRIENKLGIAAKKLLKSCEGKEKGGL